jgi:uncharacterized SAM-dependent methyltransferase
MHYYKKTDIAKLYGVNPRTITRWIDDARRGKLELELHKNEEKFFIAKTSKNQRIMKELAQDRRKYLNKHNLKVVVPTPEFYDIYNEEQIIEIISGLDTYKEISLKFSYFKEGAYSWDAYAHQLYSDDTVNTLTSTVKLLNANESYLDTLLSKFSQVNVVDVGVGNALPTKELLAHLLEAGKLHRYIAVDISNEMLEIAQKNIKEWFGGKVTFEGYTNDISFEPFADVTAEPPGTAVNLVLLFGGTLSNFDAPEDALRVIRKSMGRNDLFVYAKKLDSPLTREQFSVLTKKEGQLLPPQCEYVLGLLGVDELYYTIEMGYNEQERARYMRIRLKQALTIEFKLSRGTWRVDLNKADTIMVWRAKHNSAFEIEKQLYANGFNPLQTSQTPDHDYMLVIADLRREGR